jgi:hypothetical protein
MNYFEMQDLRIQVDGLQDKNQKMDRYVDDLAVQMKDWLDKQLSRDKSKGRDERRIGGGGRVSAYDRNKSKSMSPDTKMRKRGEEFLKKIESLKQKIHLEGK